MKRMKRLAGLILSLVIALGVFLPTTGVQATPRYEKTQYFSWWGHSYTSSLYIGDLTQAEFLDPSSVKSSNSKVAEIDYKELYEYADPSGSYNSARIGIILKKKGTANVSFKLGTKSYKITVKVGTGSSGGSSSKYVCAVKNFFVSNVNGGKDLAKNFKKTNYASELKWEKTDHSTLKIQTKSGWKVSYVSVYGEDGSYHRNRSYRFDESGNLTLDLGEMNKGDKITHSISVNFVKGSGNKIKGSSVYIYLN